MKSKFLTASVLDSTKTTSLETVSLIFMPSHLVDSGGKAAGPWRWPFIST